MVRHLVCLIRLHKMASREEARDKDIDFIVLKRRELEKAIRESRWEPVISLDDLALSIFEALDEVETEVIIETLQHLHDNRRRPDEEPRP